VRVHVRQDDVSASRPDSAAACSDGARVAPSNQDLAAFGGQAHGVQSRRRFKPPLIARELQGVDAFGHLHDQVDGALRAGSVGSFHLSYSNARSAHVSGLFFCQ
jgi:hypothetical protein